MGWRNARFEGWQSLWFVWFLVLRPLNIFESPNSVAQVTAWGALAENSPISCPTPINGILPLPCTPVSLSGSLPYSPNTKSLPLYIALCSILARQEPSLSANGASGTFGLEPGPSSRLLLWCSSLYLQWSHVPPPSSPLCQNLMLWWAASRWGLTGCPF